MANPNSWRENRERHRAREPLEPPAALAGDDLYGDLANLRRYRDAARDEHRRFAADYERERGNLGRADALVEYDRVDAARFIEERQREYAAQRGPGWRTHEGQRYRPEVRRAEAQLQQQQYRGRGPRGYQRSDERIYEDVCERLTEDDRIDASDIEVSVTNGEVTLSGTVRSRTSKRRAAQVVEELRGVKEVHNNIRVSDEQVTFRVAREGAP